MLHKDISVTNLYYQVLAFLGGCFLLITCLTMTEDTFRFSEILHNT